MADRNAEIDTKPPTGDLERKSWRLCMYCYEKKADVERRNGIEFKCCGLCAVGECADWL
jgi:hypothetical protein